MTLEQARSDLDNSARELSRRYPDFNTGWSINARTLLEASVGDYRKTLNLLLAAVGCVLLIALECGFADRQRSFRRGVGDSTRGACAPRQLAMRLLLDVAGEKPAEIGKTVEITQNLAVEILLAA